MRTTSYPKRTEKNILDSDGTVIFTFGKLTWGSELTRKLAKTHGFPCLHVDLNKVSVGEGAGLVRPWIEKNKIKVLNVAGSRASKAPTIYDLTKQILNAAIGMDKMQFNECTDCGRLQKFQAYVPKGAEFFEGPQGTRAAWNENEQRRSMDLKEAFDQGICVRIQGTEDVIEE